MTEESAGWVEPAPDGAAFLRARGQWTIARSGAIERHLARMDGMPPGDMSVDLSGIARLDTAGAWLLFRLIARLRAEGRQIEVTGVRDAHRPLIEIVARIHADGPKGGHTERVGPFAWLEGLGRGLFDALDHGKQLLNFHGMVTIVFLRTLLDPRRLRPKALVTQIEITGLNALPIVGLLSFLIGVVLAYLMSDQLTQFGAEVYTVNLLGLSITREIGVLLTAIMIAGRSGSAFTAQIGTMKVTEEIDAMGTLGLDPIEVLVIPRVLALMLTLPILTIWSDVAGILGGAVMTMVALDLTPARFLSQLKEAIDLGDVLVGLVKAPVHAYIIAMVGCYEGLRVRRTAESVGRQTTLSVVESIFLVIVATAAFAILFSVLGI
ncbi:MlaE family lipid ABC transporter permease subunit [Marivibrio halodurans]|uniref:MlaE family lipid ABC transporter permease subunit n=1 Tax=Marivibrio halodurans TaxID=2039722 RepID=A0A8J7SMS4_9PROT|nr:MlaE family lipid ABC transporter permease subunit [Marivibrio halodurans]MBP5857583.1 MlaE family lipid ABC transporter permease subunit [Marivibrio halodurans]